jgi:hypothetical protein
MRQGIVLVVLVTGLLVAAADAVALPQVLVRSKPAYLIEPAAGSGALAWAQATKSRPNRFAVYVKPSGAGAFRASRAGRRAFVWGGAWDGTSLVYSEFGGATANLWFFDRITRARTAPPAGVNTSASENAASQSGDWLLFRRTSFSSSTERIVLRNLSTGGQRILARTSGRRYVQPGNVAGDYLTWFRCPNLRKGTGCRAFRYRISTRTTRPIPRPKGKSQYAVSVTPAGTVYYAESANINCGARLKLRRFRNGARRTLVDFRRNQDLGVTSARRSPNGSTSVFYDRFNCRTGTSDLYKVVDR